MYPENPGGTQAIVGSTNMGYISDTAGNRTYYLFYLKREPNVAGTEVVTGVGAWALLWSLAQIPAWCLA